MKEHSLKSLFASSFCVFVRARGSAEICQALPDFNQQGEGGPTGALSAGPLPGYGGGDGSGGGTVSGVHRVGQGGEEDLSATSSRGECKILVNKLNNSLTKL